MKNTFGTNISVTLFGESHGECIGAVLDGFAPGVEVDEDFICTQLDKRRAVGLISTSRKESDNFKIVSGVFCGKTTGTPICIIINNENTHSKDYESTRFLARPGHADYTAYEKYHGFEDYRGGGHFSGRLTAPVVAAGAIAISALKKKSIHIGTHIKSLGGVLDREFEDLERDINALNEKTFAVLSDQKSEEMTQKILEAKESFDSVGGVLESAVIGMPAGVGEPWFDTVEGVLSHALFSIPAVKGVEFGCAFEKVNGAGSEYNDDFYMSHGVIKTKTNNNGGINGGITNGMPIVFKTAIKPTPSIYKKQNTVNFKEKTDEVLQIKGRHDPAVIHRARVVVDSVTALALCDLLATRFGVDYLGE